MTIQVLSEKSENNWDVARLLGVSEGTVRYHLRRTASGAVDGRSSKPFKAEVAALAFAKIYNSKMPITACDLLYDRVLPFYEALGIPVEAILTDNGRKFCGRPAVHPYELLTAMEGIKHRTTKIRSPRTNAFVERMNRTLLDECFRVQGRTT